MSDLVPDGWELQTIAAVANIYAGGTPNRGNLAYYGGNVPWVKSGEVKSRFVTKTQESITELALKNSTTSVTVYLLLTLFSTGVSEKVEIKSRTHPMKSNTSGCKNQCCSTRSRYSSTLLECTRV